jgi:Uma2 family endonuclease
MSIVAEKLLTAEEFYAMPDDGRRTELVRGRIVEEPHPTFLHGVVCMRIVGLTTAFVEGRPPSGWWLCNGSGVVTERNPDSVRGPDLSYFSYQRIPKDSIPDGYAEVAPEQVFEVKSPSDRRKAIHAKAGEYLAAGTLVVCVVDPETKEITVYNDTAPPAKKSISDELTLPEVFPDFCVPVRRFFE